MGALENTTLNPIGFFILLGYSATSVVRCTYFLIPLTILARLGSAVDFRSSEAYWRCEDSPSRALKAGSSLRVESSWVVATSLKWSMESSWSFSWGLRK